MREIKDLEEFNLSVKDRLYLGTLILMAIVIISIMCWIALPFINIYKY